MKEKRRLEVFWETHEITTISCKRNRPAAVFCRSCRTITLHLTISECASVLELSEAAIYRFLVTNQIHSVETAAGVLLVCLNSLLNSAIAKEEPKTTQDQK